jgi:hypothetical protein
MKKILVTTLVACALVSSALAQGQITFSAGSTPTDNRIRFSTDGTTSTLVPAGNPAQAGTFGNLNIALYGAPVGTALNIVGGFPDLTGAWKIQTSPVLQQLVAPGTMTGKIVQMPASVYNAAGEMQLTVVAWTGTAADFNAAKANPTGLFAWTGDKLSGGALTWVSGSGSATSPYVITKGASAYNGLVLAPIPEPSTFALAGLGAAALLIFRRRQ